ncbi:MAG: sulfite exporter TauE/SafE family protein [Firmicutes bacterium]|nr:sulfite exporter TauE/SafE family protein [Bacillota bacterium]
MLPYETWQIALASAAAFLIGVSKTGVPGIGILVVPLLAAAFGGRASVGTMLPMLIVGDIFAVRWYRQHTQWKRLVELIPWVLVGMALGAYVLWRLGEMPTSRDLLEPIIGTLVLVMLAIHLLRQRWGERLSPHSPVGIASTGTAAGFATTVSNAAGPIMGIYLTSLRLPKEQFMGTSAWYYFAVNLSKLPVFIVLSLINPEKPIITVRSLLFNVTAIPVIVAGVYVGRWLLPRIPQKLFDEVVLILAAIAAVKLIIG